MHLQGAFALETFIQGKLSPTVRAAFMSFWRPECPLPPVPTTSDRQGWMIAWGFAAGSGDAVNRCPQDCHYTLGYRLGQAYVSEPR